MLLELISLVSYVFFFLGFYAIGCVFNKGILRTIPILLKRFFVLSTFIGVCNRQWFGHIIAMNVIIECLVFDSLRLAFRIGLLQLKDGFGRLTQKWHRRNGFRCFISGTILAPLGVFLMIPAILLEALLLYNCLKPKHSFVMVRFIFKNGKPSVYLFNNKQTYHLM